MIRLLKYVRAREAFIVFAEPESHSRLINFNVISAGFCHFNRADLCWICYGNSVSLNLSSLDEDSELLNRQMNREY
jgi:hypothetical protein